MSAGQIARDTAVSVWLHSALRQLEVEWADATRSVYTHAELRRQCKCAACEHARRTGTVVAQTDDVSVTHITAAGPAALQLHFSDGHNHGIYPFAYLRELTVMTR